MSSTIQVLNEAIESGDEWKKDHVRAMQCVELEKLIRLGLNLYGLFRGADDLWSRRVQAGAVPFDSETAKALHQAFAWWIKPCPGVLKEIGEFEFEGYPVKGAAELRDAYAETKSLLRIDIEELTKKMCAARAA